LLAPFPEEIEAIGLIGSIMTEHFHEYSDLDIYIIFAKGKYNYNVDKCWRKKIYDILSDYHRDKNIFCYEIGDLIKIITWYVFEMASDSILIYDHGKVKKNI